MSSVQSLSCVRPCSPMDCRSPGFPVHHQLGELTQTHVHWVDDATQWSFYPLASPFPSTFPNTRVFSNKSVRCIRCPEYWSFSFSIGPSNEYSGWICFRINLFDPLAVQGTLKRFLQHHSSKTSVLWQSAIWVQIWCPYMTTGKTIALSRRIFVSKVMSLYFLISV